MLFMPEIEIPYSFRDLCTLRRSGVKKSVPPGNCHSKTAIGVLAVMVDMILL
jgi:hypothetical protein